MFSISVQFNHFSLWNQLLSLYAVFTPLIYSERRSSTSIPDQTATVKFNVDYLSTVSIDTKLKIIILKKKEIAGFEMEANLVIFSILLNRFVIRSTSKVLI